MFLQFMTVLSLFSISYFSDDSGLESMRKRNGSRSPASYVPRDDIEAVPVEVRGWTEDLLVEDSAGVLSRIGSTFADWNQRREYARLWNLESTGYHGTPDEQYRESYLKKQFLRYLDKRVTGGIKRSSRDSGLYQIARVQNALRPNTEASISKNIKLKFRAKVLRGRVTMKVENPWVDYSTNFTVSGEIDMWLRKKIEVIDVTASFNYRPLENMFVAEIERPLSENILARLSSRQPASGEKINNSLHLMYNKGF
jgi:hypothetical protein